jgi:hypothetical protein
MPDEATNSDAPDRDEEQDERLKRLEKETSEEKVGFGTVVKWVKGAGVIIGVVAVIVGYGVQYGQFTSAIETNTKAIIKLQTYPEQCRANLSKLKDAVQKRLRQDENAVGEIRGSMMALRTEVRVRHEGGTFVAAPVGVRRPSKATIVKVKRLQDAQEDIAAKAADLAIDQAEKAAPSHHDDPLQALTF